MPASPTTIRVVGISGSLREGSVTRMAVEYALVGANEVGAETKLLDLRDYELPWCDGRRDDRTYPQDVHRLRGEVASAHGILLGTPEYHASFSGVLKNALDLMGFREFEGKMIGLIGVSGGKMGAVNALNSLRMIGRSLHAWVIPEQVSISEGWRLFDSSGVLTDAVQEAALLGVGRQVARFAYLHSSAQIQEFMQLWEKAPYNPGAQSWSEGE